MTQLFGRTSCHFLRVRSALYMSYIYILIIKISKTYFYRAKFVTTWRSAPASTNTSTISRYRLTSSPSPSPSPSSPFSTTFPTRRLASYMACSSSWWPAVSRREVSSNLWFLSLATEGEDACWKTRVWEREREREREVDSGSNWEAASGSNWEAASGSNWEAASGSNWEVK